MIEGLPDRLKEARRQKGYTQQFVADYLGITREQVGLYEKGSTPGSDILMKLATLYSLSADYLLGIDKEKTLIIRDLKDTQIQTLHRVADEFRDKNKNR